MNQLNWTPTALAAGLLTASMFTTALAQDADKAIVHDAEYYVLEAQHAKEWAGQDIALQAKIDALKKKHGRPPNLIHIMWDDTAYGDLGIPAIQKCAASIRPTSTGWATKASCSRACIPKLAARRAVRPQPRAG